MAKLSKTSVAMAVSLAVASSSAVAVDKMVITGSQAESLRDELQLISGGTNFVSPQDEARLSTLRDALDYQPGVVIQEFFGGIDQPRLSIRGSGIQSNPVNRGVLLLEDGIPLNEADGSFVIGTVEPRDSAHIIVKRGSNARETGSTSLGGSLNFVPQYGSSEQNMLRLEAGSFERFAGQVSINQKIEQGDFHISASADTYDGYRNHSAGDRQALRSNLGLKISDDIFTRFYLSHTDLEFEIPFVVPKGRVTSNPKGVMGDGNTPQDMLLNAYNRDPHRETEQTRLANKTRIQLSETSAQTYAIYIQSTDDSFVDPLGHADTDTQTLGLQWQHDMLLDKTKLQFAASWNNSDMDRSYHASNIADGTKLQQFADLDMDAENTDLSFRVNHPLSEQWSFDGQLRWNRACRDAYDRTDNETLNQCWNGHNVTAGLNYMPAANQRWFINLSTSSEAPTFWEITEVVVAPNNPASAQLNLTELDLQEAITLEVGGQGSFNDSHHWSVSVYRSQVEDELISVANMVGGRGLTSNYSDDTIHQGVELGLNGGDRLHYRLAWNYSDFSFDGGIYDGNQIAAIPEHMITAEVGYQFTELDLSMNLHWLPEDTYVDHMNTTQQDSYAVWGMKLDYQPANKGWRGFVQIDNLTDEAYASSYVIRNQSSLNQPTFLPGNGRSISAGVQIPF